MIKKFLSNDSVESQTFNFDIQRFATGNAIKIGGVVNNVEVGDTFAVEDAKYTVLAVEKDSVTAIVEGTPAENLGKQIVIGDGKSIDGVTYQTTTLEDADSEISTKYTYKLDIGGNAVFVTVFDNAIESVTNSGGNSLSVSGDNYTIKGKNFSLSLVDGIPHAAYDEIKNVAKTLDKITYSFSVDSKPVEVVVKNDAISSVTVDSNQVGTAAGTYFVGTRQLNLSYANGNFSAQTAAPVSASIISSVATYRVGNKTVTVTDGKLSTSTATVNGNTATLTYSADTKKITATYSVTTTSTKTTGDPNTYNVTLPDNTVVQVKIADGKISSVTKSDGTEINKDSNNRYPVLGKDDTIYDLTLNYNENALTAATTVTTTISDYVLDQFYQVAVVGKGSAQIAVRTQVDNVKLYQGIAEISPDNGVYTVTVGSGDSAKEVKLTYDTETKTLKKYDEETGTVVDLSKLTADYEAKDGETLTGTLSGNYKISIAAGATVTLSGVTIDQTNNGKPGITCEGNAIINLEGTNTVTGAVWYAGIQAGGGGTTLTIRGSGSLTAQGGTFGAGIGSNDRGTCGNILISGGTVEAESTGALSAGIGSSGHSTCGDITITDTVTSVTATSGGNDVPKIGAGTDGKAGTVTIKGTIYQNGYTGGTITGSSGEEPSDDEVEINLISATQIFTVDDGTKVTFMKSGNDTTYKIGTDDAKELPDTNKITVGEKEYTVTISDGTVTKLEYDETEPLTTANDKKTTTTNSTRQITPTFDATQTSYTFAVNGKNVSVAVDSSGNMTYNGKAVADNKITVGGVEVTLNVSGKEITGASYLGKYSPVTNIEQVDAYKATIDGQEVSFIFDANKQCTVEVNGKNYRLTKTEGGATFTSEVEKVGVEDSRTYLIEVGGEKYWIGCTFDESGNVSAVTSDDKNLSIDGTTIKIGDYTVEVGGTKDALTTSATLTVYGEGVRDVEVKQLFALSGVKSTDGITVKNNVVTLTEVNLKGEDVTISGKGYTLALDKNYSPTTAGEHFEGNVYKSESYSDGYEISDDGKSISYIAETPATDLFTLSGVKSTDGITVVDNVVTLTEVNLKGEDVTISGKGYTLALDKNYSPTTAGEHFEGNVYKSESYSDGYEISDDGKSISYIAETPATDLFTLSGVKSTDGITVENNVVTLTAANLNNQDATISGDGYTLALDKNYSPTTAGEHFEGNVYKSESYSDGYEISDDGKSISYIAETPATDLFTLSGVKSTDGITVKNNVVTLTEANLKGEDVTISGKGYTLAIADDVEQPTKKSKQWTQLDEDTYLYTSGLTTAGYKLSGNKIVYSDEIVTGERYTITGAANTELISKKDETEEVEEDSLNRRKVVLIETDEHNPESNLVFYGENYAEVTIGAGQDSFITYDGARSKAEMSDANNVTVVSFDGKVKLNNYDMDNGSVILVQDVDDIVEAIKTDSVKLFDNKIRISSSSRVTINNLNDDSTTVKLITYGGETQAVGFTGINGGNLDMSEYREKLLLKDNYAEKSSVTQKNKPSTLISGNGNDTILAGTRDFIDGGDGKNQIFLTPYDLRQPKDGATIASGGNGINIVHNFHEGFGYDGDVIQVDDFNNLKFKFETDGLLLTADNSGLKFDGIGTTSANDKPELIQLTDGSSTIRAVIAKSDQTVLVRKDSHRTPNAFFGNRSGLDFSDYNDNVEINLADGTGKLGMWDATFSGINKLQAGDGLSTLIGSESNETLIAGDGHTSIWGGKGNDDLIGKGDSSDKNGRTTFFFLAGDGHDVIYDFNFTTTENDYSGLDDRIDITEANAVTDVFLSGNDVVLQINDSDDYLRIKDAGGKDFHINNLIAKVDRKNIAYDGLANCYVAKDVSSLTVDSSVGSAEIWLDSSHGTFFLGEIHTLDASALEGNTSLVGNEFNNTIIAGQGDSSLWGGFSPTDDLLIGGDSRNTFFYCNGNGHDTIQGINDGDRVILSDVFLNQIISTEITDDSISIYFVDGGSLKIDGRKDVTYQLADGSKYSASHERLEWDSK